MPALGDENRLERRDALTEGDDGRILGAQPLLALDRRHRPLLGARALHSFVALRRRARERRRLALRRRRTRRRPARHRLRRLLRGGGGRLGLRRRAPLERLLARRLLLLPGRDGDERGRRRRGARRRRPAAQRGLAQALHLAQRVLPPAVRRVEQHAVQVGVPRRLPQRLELRLGCGGFSCEDGDLSRVRRLTLARRRFCSLQCGLGGLQLAAELRSGRLGRR